MAEYQVKLKKREEVAAGTMAFHFEKPAGFTFVPGQAVDMTLLNPPETDAEGNTRAYSIASAPSEEDLIFATRMRDTAFKRVLGRLPLGSAVKVDGPWGELTIPAGASKPIVFLTGGIGITPFRSMLVHAAAEKSPLRFFLFYSNRRPEDAAFLTELQNVERRNPHFKLIATMTQMKDSHQPWAGARGYIDRQLLERHLGTLDSAEFYIAGPPEMVKAMQALLKTSGVAADRIHTEEFAGY